MHCQPNAPAAVDGAAAAVARPRGHLVSAALLPVRLPGRVAGPGPLRLLPRGPALEPMPGATHSIPLRFEPPVDDLIRQLKYHGAIAHARVLGVLLAAARAAQRGAPLPRLLVPGAAASRRAGASAASTRRPRSRATRGACSRSRWPGTLLRARARYALANRARRAGAAPKRARRVRGARAARQRERCWPRPRGHRRRRDDHGQHGERSCARVLLAAGVRQVEVWAVARADVSSQYDSDSATTSIDREYRA